MAEFKRQIALKVRIKDLLSGEYFKEEGMNPNYIKAKDGRLISRVNLIATVLGFEEGENSTSMILDDGSGKISVRIFEGNFDVNVGEIVLIIGRPREYGGEKYLFPEIVKKINDVRWIKLRGLELQNEVVDVVEYNSVGEVVEDVIEIEEKKEDVEKSPSEKIIDKIKELDKGDGVDIEKVVKEMLDGERLVNLLLKEGEIFEIRPGRLKVLE